VQEVLAQIPWYHNLALLERLKTPEERLWYARQTIQYGWSRNVLTLQIESGLYKRQGKAVTNFERTLPPPQSDLANEVLKDPYNLDFLALREGVHERHVQQALVTHLRDFLLELGAGFAFVGNEYVIEVGGEEFRIDLLFYHLKLSCFVVIEIKMSDFRPEYAGKLNFYLSAVDELLRREHDQPTIGILLCRGKNKVVCEFALRDIGKPMGVSEMHLTEDLPEQLRRELPSIEALEVEFTNALEESEKEGPAPEASGPK